ncbi:alcohol oxidase [Mycena belliarum]|uniref:Alcohol oxidase n=1 Tax=Mycena belliarum TaxID=1033014 RepID=A0AAD6U9B7_9AGAR|nr:alcohol oxidase [Mycena belliae]
MLLITPLRGNTLEMVAALEDVLGHAFDFVIVGGGTCGLTLAARLTEDLDRSVLVLEAGPANLDDPNILTPALFGLHTNHPQYDWSFQTVPQKGAMGRTLYFGRGKGLGGTSAINMFQYHRPAKSDIDAFETLGNAGWNWDLLQKYYAKAETFIPPSVDHDTMKFDLNARGSEGPLGVGYAVTLSGLESPYHETLKNFGITREDEPFSGNTLGTWLTPLSVHPTKRIRSYAANMYYQPNAARPNLTVLVCAHVTKIRLKTNGGVSTAEAVCFRHSGNDYEVPVKKEVILSAGTVMSPQILELSGIGNPAVLGKVGIEVHVDLPGVGENVQEHIQSGSSYQIREDKEDAYNTFDCLSDPKFAAAQFAQYKSEGTGVCGMGPTCMTFASLSTIAPNDAERLQQALEQSIASRVASGACTPALEKQLRIQLARIKRGEPELEMVLAQTFYTKPNPPEPGRKYITLQILLNHPISRGTIHVASNDPSQPPAIDPHYFESEHDLKMLVELIKFNRRLMQQEPLCSIVSDAEVNPGPDYQTDEQIGEWLKAHFTSTWHTAGSCSMLPLADGGVVDPQLKVYKTTNIRVIDISIVPLHVGAHTQATAYALGELGADIIKGKVLLGAIVE